MKTFGKIVAALSLGLFRVWGVLTLYGWFIVPLGAPAVTFPQFYGAVLTYSALTHKYKSHDNEPDEDFGENLLGNIIWVGISLGVGWVVLQFI